MIDQYIKILEDIVKEGYRLKAQHFNKKWRKALEDAENLLMENTGGESCMIDEDLKALENQAVKMLIEKGAKKYKRFFSQKEFEKNIGRIFIITGTIRNLEKKIAMINEPKIPA